MHIKFKADRRSYVKDFSISAYQNFAYSDFCPGGHFTHVNTQIYLSVVALRHTLPA